MRTYEKQVLSNEIVGSGISDVFIGPQGEIALLFDNDVILYIAAEQETAVITGNGVDDFWATLKTIAA